MFPKIAQLVFSTAMYDATDHFSRENPGRNVSNTTGVWTNYILLGTVSKVQTLFSDQSTFSLILQFLDEKTKQLFGVGYLKIILRL